MLQLLNASFEAGFHLFVFVFKIGMLTKLYMHFLSHIVVSRISTFIMYTQERIKGSVGHLRKQ